MTLLTIATTQMPCTWDLPRNLDLAEQLVREAAAKGAQVILLQELFATPYFCICLLYTSPSPRDATLSRMPSSA